MCMKIKIGLIDSGINAKDFMFGNNSSVINAWKGIYDSYTDFTGHGTQCANLMLRNIENIDIYNVKVFDKSLSTSCGNILNAMSWCINNKMNIINLSLSIIDLNYYYEFAKICNEAERNNIIIVASADNLGRPCIPAYLKNVIGVGAASVSKSNDYFYTESSIQIYGDASIESHSGSIALTHSTSFATARLTGIIAKIISENVNINFVQLINILSSSSKEYIKGQIIVENPDIDFDKCIIPINIEGDIKFITQELKDTSKFHITKNTKHVLLLINLTNNPHFHSVELKIRENIIQNNKISFVSSNTISDSVNHKLSFYDQIPLELSVSYGKAIIDKINNNSATELIVVFLDKPIVPFNGDYCDFFYTYTLSEISLLFGLQVDDCIPVINETIKLDLVKRNIECLKNLFNIDVLLLLYNSLQSNISDEYLECNNLNSKSLREISNRKFIEFRTDIKKELNLDIYDLQEDIQIVNNFILEFIESDNDS